MRRPTRFADYASDLLAFVATVLLLLVIPRVLDWLDDVLPHLRTMAFTFE